MKTVYMTLGAIAGFSAVYSAFAFVAQDFWWAFEMTDDHFFARLMFVLVGGLLSAVGAMLARDHYDWNK